jgi:uncharacterized damage-inducible protein DinB
MNIETLRVFLKYSDWANGQIVAAATALGDAQLDRAFDMGRGSLRTTLMHIWAGESVWVSRWQGRIETPWPNEDETGRPSMIDERLADVYRERDAFVSKLGDGDLSRVITYRDSKGSLFKATLSDMMIQMIVHSTHHRAQAVNMLRRVGGTSPEVDYMMWVRKPA